MSDKKLTQSTILKAKLKSREELRKPVDDIDDDIHCIISILIDSIDKLDYRDAKLLGLYQLKRDFDEVLYISDDMITLSVSDYDGDNYTCNIPLSWLDDTSLIEKAIEDKKRENADKENKAAQEKEDKERKEYECLKAKFEKK